jgi:hypothetical protein
MVAAWAAVPPAEVAAARQAGSVAERVGALAAAAWPVAEWEEALAAALVEEEWVEAVRRHVTAGVPGGRCARGRRAGR